MALVKLNNRGVRSATTFGSISALGEMRFIKKLTASSDSELSFVDGTDDVVLDDTYKEYLFTFHNMHPDNNAPQFSFQGNASGGSGYNETITSTAFKAYHYEADTLAELGYTTARDQAQGTAFQDLTSYGVSDGNDSGLSGYLHLFNPSSTTFVKHFISRVCSAYDSADPIPTDSYCSGYFNTTSAIDEIQFKFSSGNIDAGDICLYGIN